MPGMLRVDRNRFRKLCSNGLNIHYGKTLTDLEYGVNDKRVTAHFADGIIAQGYILIGADGPRSAVREQLLGKEQAAPKPLGLVSMTTTVN
jgi:2-polyprenyl-6-methoxyphenol hydroxylase-like FAD-dependent oxidoreductase